MHAAKGRHGRFRGEETQTDRHLGKAVFAIYGVSPETSQRLEGQ